MGQAPDPVAGSLGTWGRDHELAIVGELVASASSGRRRVLLVEGEAGIGKTQVLREIAARAHAAGFTVLAGRCDELSRARPFHGLLDALSADRLPLPARELASAMWALVGPAGRPGRDPDQLPAGALEGAVTELWLDFVESLSVRRPVLVAVDDLQWADPATLTVLRAITGRMRHHPVLLVGAFRSLPRPAELDRLLDAAAADTHIRLSALDRRACCGLASEILGVPPTGNLIRKIDAAGGNAFFVIELVRALLDDGAVVIRAGEADSRDASLPPPVRLTIMRRLSELPEPTTEALRKAAVLGARFSLQHLASLTGAAASELVTALAPALRAGVISESDDLLRFRHDLVREAIYEDMPLAFRQLLHADAAHALVAHGAPPSEVLEHVDLAAATGDEALLAWLGESAAAAVVASPRLAVALLEQALSVVADSSRRNELRVQLLDALVAAGRLVAAEELAHELLTERVGAEAAMQVRSGLGRALFQRGDFERAIPVLVDAAGGSAPERRARDLALAALASVFTRAPDADGRISEALDAVLASGDDVARPHALTAEAERARNLGSLVEAAELARRAGDAARRIWHDPSLPAAPVPVVHLLQAGHLDEAEDVLQSGYWAATEVSAAMQPLRHSFLAVIRYLTGRWDDAAAEAETAVVLADEVGTRWHRSGNLALLCRLAVHRNDTEQATAYERASVAHGDGEAAWATAVLLELQGDREELRTHLSGLRQRVTASVEAHVETWVEARDLVRLYLEVGDAAAAGAMAALAEELAARSDVPWTRAQALYLRGLVDGDAHRLQQAVTEYRATPMSPALADACEAAGAHLASSGATPEARRLLLEAAELYARFGAVRDLARVDRSLRQLGVRRGRRGARKRPTTGWDSLTPTERKVADLIRRGLTYREIAGLLYVSKRTVETHAGHVFAKLGLASRRELERRHPASDGSRRDDAPWR